MKGLSLTQPWATLVAIGAKRIETRSRRTDYRGLVAIHASKRWAAEDRTLCWEPEFRAALEPTKLIDFTEYADLNHEDAERFDLPLGAVVAVAVLAACKPTTSLVSARFEDRNEMIFGDYGPGRYGFVLTDVRALREPVPCRGALGLWAVDDAIRCAIEGAL